MAAEVTQPSPGQLFVFARGVEPLGSEYPGTVQRFSHLSSWSFHLAVYTALYCSMHTEVSTAVFSGLAPLSMKDEVVPEISAAEAMQAVAVQHFPELRSAVETESRTPYGGLARSVQLGLLEKDRPTGLIVWSRKEQTALNAALLILPRAVKVVLPAEEYYSFEYVTPPRSDGDLRAEARIHKEAMRDVSPGDVEAIARRERLMQVSLRLTSALIRLFDGPPPDDLQYSR